MFNLAAIPSYSTGNSTEQDLQEQVGRQGTTNHVRGRFSNETTDQRERRLQANRERNRRRRQQRTSEQREQLLAQRRQARQEETEEQRNRRMEYQRQYRQGASTFPGLRIFIADRSKTRVLALLHIAAHGLASAGCTGWVKGGECDSLNQVDSDVCTECIKKNSDMIVGVKVRLSASAANDGINEEEAFRRALNVSAETNVPLMTHHTFSTIAVQQTGQGRISCPGSLRPGDIYTHCFHGWPSTIINPLNRQIYSDVFDAQKRGVLFDVGHGVGSFSWTVAEICAKEGLWPDIISSDLHLESVDGPAYDLLTVMTKMLHVGMPLNEVIKAVTMTPAAAIRRSDTIGSLGVGHAADITVVRLEDADIDLEDCNAQLRKVKQRFVPVAVWKDGVCSKTSVPNPFPNKTKLQELDSLQDQLLIKDES